MYVVELKGRTNSQLPLMNQSVSAVWRNEQCVIYTGRTADINLSSFDYEGWPMLEDAYANLATIPNCIKTGDESVWGVCVWGGRWNVTIKPYGVNSVCDNTRRKEDERDEVTSQLVSLVLFCRRRWTLFFLPPLPIFNWFLFNRLFQRY